MKRLLLSLLVILLGSACGSKNLPERAAELAEVQVKKQYPEIHNYKVISTHVDTLYSSLLYEPGISKTLAEFSDLTTFLQTRDSLLSALYDERAASDTLWDYEVDTEAQKKLDAKIKEIEDKGEESFEQFRRDYLLIKSAMEKVDSNKVIGWLVIQDVTLSDDNGLPVKDQFILALDKDEQLLLGRIYTKKDFLKLSGYLEKFREFEKLQESLPKEMQL